MPTEAQDAIARDLLDLIRTEREWDKSFADPRSDALFDRMAQKVRADIAIGRVITSDPSSFNV
jgi:hypothetical protein